MHIGSVGLGAVVETAYLPALKRLALPLTCYGFDSSSERNLPGITRTASLAALLAEPLDMLFITTSSLQHLAVLEVVLATTCPRIVVEKPIVASLTQVARLRQLLAQPEYAARIFALDHWMARDGALKLALGQLDTHWQPENGARLEKSPITSLQDITRIDGFLLEPSGFNAQGEPIALNFTTGEPDTRKLSHPDGVILDIGTHVLAMLRETIHCCGGNGELRLSLLQAKDRLGNTIAQGDIHTAEGEACLQGETGSIPLHIWLNKYAGPGGGRKGLQITLRDGRLINHDRRDNREVVELIDGERIQRWTRSGAIYEHCLGGYILGVHSLFVRAPAEISRLTRWRTREVEQLLQLQKQLREPHSLST